MLNAERSIEIDLPISTVYNQYTQFEQFPQFMEGVKSVKQIDDSHLHWVAEVGGKDLEWDAEITEQQPDRLIAWRSTSGPHNVGVVSFEPLSDDRTKLTVKLEAEADGLDEKVGGAVGVLDNRLEGDLERFRDYIIGRGSETGAYRGEISGGEVVDRKVSSDELDSSVV